MCLVSPTVQCHKPPQLIVARLTYNDLRLSTVHLRLHRVEWTVDVEQMHIGDIQLFQLLPQSTVVTIFYT